MSPVEGIQDTSEREGKSSRPQNWSGPIHCPAWQPFNNQGETGMVLGSGKTEIYCLRY